MKNDGRVLRILNCKRCGWKWIPKKERVILCPKCKSAYWDIEKKKIRISMQKIWDEYYFKAIFLQRNPSM